MPTISRRRFLGAAAVASGGAIVLAAGAGVGALVGGRADVAAPPFVAPTAPEALVRAVARERELVAAYIAAGAAHPELAARLAPILADHQAHAGVLDQELARITQATTSPGAPGASTPSASTGAPEVPPAQALAALAALEISAAAAASADCLAGIGEGTGEGVDLLVLLGSICAAESVHVGMLT